MISKDEFSKIVLDHMRSHHTKIWGLSDEEFGAFALANIWLLTVTPGHTNPDQVMKHFRIAYFKFLKLMFGSKPARNAHIQPMGYAFLDFAGTRNGRMSVSKELPHVHALLMVHPMTRARFEGIPKEGTVFDGAEHFDPARKSLEHVSSYAMKGVIGRHGFRSDEEGKSWLLLPNTTVKDDPVFKAKLKARRIAGEAKTTFRFGRARRPIGPVRLG